MRGGERSKRERVQCVAGVDSLRRAPNRPQRRSSVTCDIVILDVVVNQRKIVKPFERRRCRHRFIHRTTACFARPQTQRGSHEFSCGLRSRAPARFIEPSHMVTGHASGHCLRRKLLSAHCLRNPRLVHREDCRNRVDRRCKGGSHEGPLRRAPWFLLVGAGLHGILTRVGLDAVRHRCSKALAPLRRL